jgi:hypothetical protein
MAKEQPYLISPEEAERLGIDDGSKLVNRLAKDQKITVELTPEQMEVIIGQWRSADNTRPAELTFTVEGEPQTSLRVAAYAYYSDSCCA